MHDTDDEASIYRDREGDGEEYRRAMAHACTGLTPGAPAAYSPDDSDWATYYRDIFSTQLAPHFINSYNAAAAGESDRLIQLDETFANGLDAPLRERLATAAGAVFEARSGASAMRLLDRLREKRPGCSFTTAFAAHAASFHVPLLHALVGYLAVEWRAGSATETEGLEKSGSWRTLFERELLAAPEPVRQVLARNLCGWAEVA